MQWPQAGERRPNRSTKTGASILLPDDAQMDATWCCSLLLAMRSTVTLDDELLARAEQLWGLLECSALLRQALQAFLQRESAKRLAVLGGSESGIDPVRGTPTNRALSRCLITCSFPSAAAKPPASQPPACLPHADERWMVGVGNEFIGPLEMLESLDRPSSPRPTPASRSCAQFCAP